MQKGRIIKVSGPLVVAEGMFDARMYDVVKVSEKLLIGEIIELKGDRASIQVYEETQGIGVGEPVYLTGAPLSVELGPGLVGSIYDGIQRPLDEIMDRFGNRISRGVELPGLSRQKKWNFIPKLKKGDRVRGGDILGEVQETPVVVHKILVPPDIEGVIENIFKGEFTVEETIAEIRLNNGEIYKVRMMQKWPVRILRPVKEKMVPDEPLVTGQRIIDTLFPVAKGGTACIPGPFGSGKCVSGDTLVLLGNGRIVPMRKIFEEAKIKGRLIKKDSYEEIYDIRGLNNPSMVSFNQITFNITEPIAAYKGKTDSTVIIKTRTGKSVEVTAIHKLFILEAGNLMQKEAKDINVGDYIASPRKIKLDLQDQPINIVNLVSDKKIFCCDDNINLLAKGYIKELIKGDLFPKTYRKYLRKRKKISLNILKQISFKISVDLVPEKICSFHGKVIRVPKLMNRNFSEFLGYIIADGNLKRTSYSIRFYNSSQELLDRFIKLAQDLFGITPYIYNHPKSNSYIAQIDCKCLFDFLVSLGVPYEQKAKNAIVPECILRSSDETIACFVGAYIACDGSLDKKGKRIEIYSASKKLLIHMGYLFLRLGIISTLYKERKDKTFRMTINAVGNLEENLRRINVIGKKKILANDFVDKKSWVLDAIEVPGFLKNLLLAKGSLSYLQRRGIYTACYCYSDRQRISIDTILKIVKELSKITELPEEVEKFINLLNEIFFDRVIEKKILSKSKEVYDIQVPLTHNFIGGNGALILHNTVLLHELSRWCDAQIIIYVAAGERGNEVCDLLLTLPQLKDPRSGRPLMERTVLIANTSNMPVAAREASIYAGITVAEYFRDMGYNVAVTVDSTSRWAEALREISGRLEEMPGEEGYPAYLGTRVAGFYERAGKVRCLGSDSRIGSLSVIGAVSPPGGDLSDPVVQATLRVVKVFWGLEDKLAYKRHFPAINWLISYSLYLENLSNFFINNVGEDFIKLRVDAMRLLQEESELEEIARLIGIDSLSDEERLVMEAARSIREDFLHQTAFHEIDTYTSLKKQYEMLKLVLEFYYKASEALKGGAGLNKIISLNVREKIARAKFILEKDIESIPKIKAEIEKELQS